MNIIISVFLEWVLSIRKIWEKILCGSMLLKLPGSNICKFCNQKCTGGVNRLKHHLAGTHYGMKPCNKVSVNARLECKEALANFKDQKLAFCYGLVMVFC